MTPHDLRHWMTGAGYSVRSLASALGVQPSTVQRWRTGEREIPPYLGLALETLERRLTVPP